MAEDDVESADTPDNQCESLHWWSFRWWVMRGHGLKASTLSIASYDLFENAI
jgi:hypothetical protein